MTVIQYIITAIPEYSKWSCPWQVPTCRLSWIWILCETLSWYFSLKFPIEDWWRRCFNQSAMTVYKDPLVNSETFSQREFLETVDMLPSFSKPKLSIVPGLKVKSFCNWTKQPTAEFPRNKQVQECTHNILFHLLPSSVLQHQSHTRSGSIHSYGK